MASGGPPRPSTPWAPRAPIATGFNGRIWIYSGKHTGWATTGRRPLADDGCGRGPVRLRIERAQVSATSDQEGHESEKHRLQWTDRWRTSAAVVGGDVLPGGVGVVVVVSAGAMAPVV